MKDNDLAEHAFLIPQISWMAKVLERSHALAYVATLTCWRRELVHTGELGEK